MTCVMCECLCHFDVRDLYFFSQYPASIHKPYSLKNNTQSTHVSQPTRDFELKCVIMNPGEHVDHE